MSRPEITDDEVMRQAHASRRLRDALRPANDVEDHVLGCLSQVVSKRTIEHLADMAERHLTGGGHDG